MYAILLGAKNFTKKIVYLYFNLSENGYLKVSVPSTSSQSIEAAEQSTDIILVSTEHNGEAGERRGEVNRSKDETNQSYGEDNDCSESGSVANQRESV